MYEIDKKPLFLFATHGAPAGSRHAFAAKDHARSLAPDAHILGTYSCQGEVNPKVLEKARSKPEPPLRIVDAPSASSHPYETDIGVLKRRIQSI